MVVGTRIGSVGVVGLVAGLVVATACGSSSSGGGGGGAGAAADAGGSDAQAATTTSGNDAAVSAGTTSDAGASTDSGVVVETDSGESVACALGASCMATDKSCVGLTRNAGATKFGLRMSAIDFAAPTAFTSGTLAGAIGGAASLSLAACNQDGTGTFSWLLQFDTTAGTLKTGGAKPVSDPTTGYSFDSETLQSFQVQPVTYPSVTPSASGAFTVTTGTDLVMPVFLDATGSSVLLLPMHQARISSGTLSSSNDCIGSYNAAGLDPANDCQPSTASVPPTPGFVDGGKLDGFITLAEADRVIISALNESLCVVLSGNSGMYGTTSSSGVTVCKRDDSSNIVYQGDWCSSTNAVATGTCADAAHVSANFAASAVEILN